MGAGCLRKFLQIDDLAHAKAEQKAESSRASLGDGGGGGGTGSSFMGWFNKTVADTATSVSMMADSSAAASIKSPADARIDELATCARAPRRARRRPRARTRVRAARARRAR